METRTSASTTVTRVMSSVITLSTTIFASISTREIPAVDSEGLTPIRSGTPSPETPPGTTTNSVPNAASITATTTTTPAPDGLDPGSSADAKSATLESTATPTIMSTELLTATTSEPLSTTAPTNTETTMTTNATPSAMTVPTDTPSTPRTTGTNPGKDPVSENERTTVAVVTMTVTEVGSCTSTFTA
ncbi:hypothetical protein ColLi_12883 [Colletotrichum liriopes]|uniref:Uncharacterized protein n=1 Tax=Colletotrichum liriopes TaxID=708192 RepID=A0AA37H0H2_9PEZI|nr:hypothetical protein ColLi_12883 [Colletotrichum liriopes]